MWVPELTLSVRRTRWAVRIINSILTADPRLVPDAVTIPELSYREAAELAYFGAKVLHPKTLRPLLKSCTTVWIRNTFAPERPGTKISPEEFSV